MLQVFALVGTIMVGVVALALIVSQTPWFRDWLRRYIVRESKQYLNGELAIGRLRGNLLFGVELSDIAVDVSGERIIAVKNVELDYSILEIISRGVVINDIKLIAPVLRVERDRNGWNLGRLVKEQRKEADREGPGRPISLQSIEIADGHVTVDDPVGTSGYRIPEQISDLDLKASYEYEPVHYSLVVDRASFRSASPSLNLTELTGKLAVRDDNLYVEKMSIRTAESSVTLDGVVQDYLNTPIIQVTTTGKVSLPEIGRVVPAASGYNLHPKFDIKADGPAEKLGLTLDVQSEAGNVKGAMTADVKAPNLGVEGDVDVANLNLAPILKDPKQRSNITGHAKLDLRVASEPEAAPITDRLSGTFAFNGPRVEAAGYAASNVKATGEFNGPRLQLDARANAYGGSATTTGHVILPARGRELAFDLRGRADNVDLRELPAATGAPKLATDLSVAEYHVTGEGKTFAGNARLNQSRVEGATIADGTTAEFNIGPDKIAYGAQGSVSNLNVQRIGRAMNIAALEKPAYDSVINGDFKVAGAQPRNAAKSEPTAKLMQLDASGTLRDSTILGGRLPHLGFDARLANGALDATLNGSFEGFDPSTLVERKDIAGKVSGTVNASAHVTDISAPITPDAITAQGKVTLTDSEVGGLRIDSANVDGKYANQVADLTTLNVQGPDLKVDASGRLALDRATDSNLKYHVQAVDLDKLGALAGQEQVQGSAVLDGTVTGNAQTLQINGTLDGSNVGYGENRALDLNATYNVTVPDLNFKDARVQSKTDATFLVVGGTQLNSVTATTTYEKQRVEFVTNIKEQKRELDARGEVILHPDHQEVHLPEFAVRTQGVEWRTAPGSEATIKYGQQRIELDNVRLVSGDQSLTVDGTFTTGGEAPTGAIKVNASNVDLQQLETLLLQNRGFTGKLNADATISGTAKAPVVEGHVEVLNGTFRTYKYESLKADVDYAGNRVELDATLQQSPTESITAKGSVPTSLFQASPTGDHVAAGDPVDLHITSTALNLGVVQGFTDLVTNVTGTLQADVRLTGTGQDPHLDGFIDIRGGGFGVPMVGTSYRGLDTRIELDPDKVRLQQFTILDEHNQPLHVDGELAVHSKQVGAVNINVNSDNFELIDNQLGDVGIDSKITISGEVRRPIVKGEVKLEAGRLEVDELLQFFYDPYATEALPDVQSAERLGEGSGSAEDATMGALGKAKESAAPAGAEATPPDAPPAPTGGFAPVTLDLHVIIPDNLVLRGDNLRPSGPTGASLGDMNITIGGDMQVRKQPGGQVTLLGTVNTVRGTYEFQGRRFDLQRNGTIRFLGEPTINPMLDITATRVIPNTGVEARVRITGTPKAPELRLTSNPPLEESDILALIVFNRPVNELGTGERASLAATAGGIATGFIAAPLGDSIGRALDLDLFEITTSTEEGELGAGLTLGQQIGERAFVKLRQQFGERSVTEFLIEYQLARFLRLQVNAAPETSGSANRIGQRRIEKAGVDLIFFFSY